jgi:hypothetical protein
LSGHPSSLFGQKARFELAGVLSPEDYRDICNVVLHQGQSAARGWFYKLTSGKPHLHRYVYGGDVVVLDVGELATEMVASIRAWFVDLQTDATPRANVTANLPMLVKVEERPVPGSDDVSPTGVHLHRDERPDLPAPAGRPGWEAVVAQKSRCSISLKKNEIRVVCCRRVSDAVVRRCARSARD